MATKSVDRRSMCAQSESRIVVIGDIHGCLDSLLRVGRLAGLIDDQHRWSADPRDQVVICGDMVDEGASSRQVLQCIRRWQQEAGAQVIALMGNHELLLLRALATDPRLLHWETVWSWADTHPHLRAFLTQHSIPRLSTEAIRHSFQTNYMASGNADYPYDYIHRCESVPGDVAEEAAALFRQVLKAEGTLDWLQKLPVAKKSGEWGFFHGGPPRGFVGTIEELNHVFSGYLDAEQWPHPLLEPYAAPTSPVGVRRWMDSEASVDALLSPFQIRHVAFGHSPGALNGIFGELAQRFGKVFKADTYCSLGVEGFLEILDDSVWAVYTEIGRHVFAKLHPHRPALPSSELLWRTPLCE